MSSSTASGSMRASSVSVGLRLQCSRSRALGGAASMSACTLDAGGQGIMMGKKVRTFAPLPRDVSLEDLVPKDHFYRRLETRLDLSFVRELVRPLYAQGGRPSVDPVVFFKLQLVVFFEDIRSERQLMGVVADRLSFRWYLGYDLFGEQPTLCGKPAPPEIYAAPHVFFNGLGCSPKSIPTMLLSIIDNT